MSSSSVPYARSRSKRWASAEAEPDKSQGEAEGLEQRILIDGMEGLRDVHNNPVHRHSAQSWPFPRSKLLLLLIAVILISITLLLFLSLSFPLLLPTLPSALSTHPILYSFFGPSPTDASAAARTSAHPHKHFDSNMSAVSARIKSLIADNVVMIFSKTYCPYCTKAKNIIKETGKAFQVLELDIEKDGSDIQSTLATMTNQKTVPNIFIKGNHIGGCSDLEALKSSGKLQELLA